jgi:hypothetical protein
MENVCGLWPFWSLGETALPIGTDIPIVLCRNWITRQQRHRYQIEILILVLLLF